MPIEGPPGDRVGVELFLDGAVDAMPAGEEDEEYAPASGRQRALWRQWPG